MYEAFLSGKLASAAALDVLAGRRSSLDSYGDDVTRSLARLLSASWGIKAALDRFPRLSFALNRLPSVWRVTEAVMRGDLASPGARGGPARAPIGALRLLARRSGDPGQEFRIVEA
jgi:hypothetical protein